MFDVADLLFARITKNLSGVEPRRTGLRFAAVAMLMRNEQSPSVLFIKRAEHAGDPWSGQVAFPGGKMRPEDRTIKDTAMRETLEEVGIDLANTAEFLGYGTLATTHTGTMDVVPTVFLMRSETEVKTNEEVASHRWVELERLVAAESRSTYRFEREGTAVELPAFKIGEYTVWGLTYRILDALLNGSG